MSWLSKLFGGHSASPDARIFPSLEPAESPAPTVRSATAAVEAPPASAGSVPPRQDEAASTADRLDDGIVLLLRDAVVASRVESGRRLDFIDLLRSIYNSGFSEEHIRKALAGSNSSPAIRREAREFLGGVEKLCSQVLASGTASADHAALHVQDFQKMRDYRLATLLQYRIADCLKRYTSSS